MKEREKEILSKRISFLVDLAVLKNNLFEVLTINDISNLKRFIIENWGSYTIRQSGLNLEFIDSKTFNKEIIRPSTQKPLEQHKYLITENNKKIFIRPDNWSFIVILPDELLTNEVLENIKFAKITNDGRYSRYLIKQKEKMRYKVMKIK